MLRQKLQVKMLSSLFAACFALGLDHVNAVTSRTPLHKAARGGHVDMAKLLIEHGADTTNRDPYRYSPPIGWAEYNGKSEMVEFLKCATARYLCLCTAYDQGEQLAVHLDRTLTR